MISLQKNQCKHWPLQVDGCLEDRVVHLLRFTMTNRGNNTKKIRRLIFFDLDKIRTSFQKSTAVRITKNNAMLNNINNNNGTFLIG